MSTTHTCPNNGMWWTKENLWKQWGSEYKDYHVFMRKFRARILKPLYQIEFIKKIEEKKTAIGLWW